MGPSSACALSGLAGRVGRRGGNGGAVVRRGSGIGSAEKSLCRGISSDERPKRPLTAYSRFLKENYSDFRQKHPGMSSVDLMKNIAGAWKVLPVSQKEVYVKATKTDWQIYEKQLATYKAQLTPAQAEALKEEMRRQRARRRLIKTRKELTVLGKPKRPRNSFNIFVAEHFKESEGISAVAKLKQLFDGWQKMSDSQKQPYLQLAEDDKVRYENEMTLWETKMVELGREDLVRSKKQKLKKKTVETLKQAVTAKASSRENKAKSQLKKSEE